MKPLVRVTQLEQLRRYLSGRYDYMTEQDVADAVTGAFQGNDRTAVGTAFHSIVETGRPACRRVEGGRAFDIDGREVTLDVAQCRVALDYRESLSPVAVHEQRTWMDYGPVVVTGCADVIDGLELRDVKTKFAMPDDGDYLDSAQWRMYCEMFGAWTFHYDFFVFDGYREEQHHADVRGLPLHRLTPPLTCHAYDGMEDDNRRLVREFAGWAKARGLWDKLPQIDEARLPG